MNGRTQTQRLLAVAGTVAALVATSSLFAGSARAQDSTATPAPAVTATPATIDPNAAVEETAHIPGLTSRTKLKDIEIQYWNPRDSRSINTFEPPKVEGPEYTGFKVDWGAGFTQQFQALHHSNTATPVIVGGVNTNQLMKIGSGFNNAMANLYLNAQLSKGMRVEITTYMSTRHHNETWVKDGFLLVDGSPWENAFLDNLMKYMTLRVGHFEVNYGDAHFRSSDAGNTMNNPLVGNLIMNAFTTEIGAEVYGRKGPWMLMGGVTGGEIRGTVERPQDRAPTYLGKVGFDKQFNTDTRVRLTGSVYSTAKSVSNTLYSGSRAGSRYYDVLANTASTVSAQAWTGDIQPGMSSKLTAMVFNPFLTWKGFEFFGEVEQAKGRAATETSDRTWNQMAGEGLYRFCNRNLYVAARYNTVDGRLAGFTSDVTVDRVEVGGGWFITPNLMMKGEYVKQQYKDYPATNINNGGVFEGTMIEGVVSF